MRPAARSRQNLAIGAKASYYTNNEMLARSKLAAIALLTGVVGLPAAEPIPLNHIEATFHGSTSNDLACVMDGVAAGPRGWSVSPKLAEPQAIVIRCAQPVEAAELDFTLFFLSGRPNNSIAEFALFYTTDTEPSLKGNWKPLEIQRFTAEVATLQRTEDGHLRAALLPDEITGAIPDDTYRIATLLPGGRATGFRLTVFPVFAYAGAAPWMAWGSPHDFVLTEFRVEVHARDNTNIALHRPANASHPLNGPQTPAALTDGLPATLAHPRDEGLETNTLGTNFFFEIDLGRVASLDHLSLRTRGDGYTDRFTRMTVRLYDRDPGTGTPPVWEGLNRADGSHSEAGTADIVRAGLGRGDFRGRYLRLSSDNPVPSSPQLAEVVRLPPRLPARAQFTGPRLAAVARAASRRNRGGTLPGRPCLPRCPPKVKLVKPIQKYLLLATATLFTAAAVSAANSAHAPNRLPTRT